MKLSRPLISTITIGKEKPAVSPFNICCKKCGKPVELKKKSLTSLLFICECGFEEEINLMEAIND